MRYAILSDIHANLTALNTVLDAVEQLNCDKIVCLGDIVGYGPFPDECCNVIRKQADIVLVGNHDYAAIGKMKTSGFNVNAASAIKWTAEHLSRQAVEFLSDLPFEYIENDVRFVHAAPCDPEDWPYIFSVYEALTNFRCFDEKLCFIGHSHVPITYFFDGTDGPFVDTNESVRILPQYRYIINVGSVGQPRDGNPESSFVVLDTNEDLIEFQRVAYNIESTQDAMQKEDLPKFLIDRLEFGR